MGGSQHYLKSENENPPTGGPAPRNSRGRKAQSRPAESGGCIPRKRRCIVEGWCWCLVSPPTMKHGRLSIFGCARNVYKLNSRQPAGKIYPHEIGIQKTHPKHRKLDSQATLSHRARGRATDGLRPKAWQPRASRRDHDPGRLSPRSAGIGGLRPAMATDRALRGSPPRSPGEEWNPQHPPNPR